MAVIVAIEHRCLMNLRGVRVGEIDHTLHYVHFHLDLLFLNNSVTDASFRTDMTLNFTMIAK